MTAVALIVAVIGALVAVVAVLQNFYWAIPLGVAAVFGGFLLFVRYRQHTPVYTGRDATES